jgi:hypothetical protein
MHRTHPRAKGGASTSAAAAAVDDDDNDVVAAAEKTFEELLVWRGATRSVVGWIVHRKLWVV